MSTWTDITKRAISKCVPKSVLDAVIDNLVWLKNAIGGAGAVEGIVNGSFESDADADGRPDGWTWTASGGSIAIESTAPGHGAKALKITSSGSGGGNVVHDDYILCTPNKRVVLGFLHWSSDAGLADTVELLWYDKAKSYLSATTIYNDATTNPTSSTRFIRGATPVTNAMFFRIRITGANDTTTGSSYWDGFEVLQDINTVVGFGTDTGTGYTPDRVHIGGVLASPTGITASDTSLVFVGVRSGIAHTGGNLAITLCDSTPNNVYTLNLSLPVGLWTVSMVGSGASNAICRIYATAIREG